MSHFHTTLMPPAEIDAAVVHPACPSLPSQLGTDFQKQIQNPRCLCFRKYLRSPGREIDNHIDQTGASTTGTLESKRPLPAGGSYPSGLRCAVRIALCVSQNHLKVPLNRKLA